MVSIECDDDGIMLNKRIYRYKDNSMGQFSYSCASVILMGSPLPPQRGSVGVYINNSILCGMHYAMVKQRIKMHL